MRTKGKITSWNDDKGYGFITPLAGGKQIFIHVSEFGNPRRRPKSNEIVTYLASKDRQGRPCAVNAAHADKNLIRNASRTISTAAILFTLMFLAAIGISVETGNQPEVLLIAYAMLSLVTFVGYAIDKSAAKRGGWRIAESTLLILGLAGGWPGGLLAQEILRHKSKKKSFRIAFWATVLVNIVVLVSLCTDNGKALFARLFV